MSELDDYDVVDHMLTILRWAWNTKEQKQRLTDGINEWRQTNDQGEPPNVLVDMFLENVKDLADLVGYEEKGKINSVRAILANDGALYINIWRSNGTDRVYTIYGSPGRIQNNILRAAIMQDRLADYAYKEIAVRYVDFDDIARAWAAGPRCRLPELEHLAHLHFEEYVRAKTEAGLPLPCKVEDFRVETIEVNHE